MSDQPIELTAITRLRHATLWELAKRLGSQANAAEQCFVTTPVFNTWVTLKAAFPVESQRRGWWQNKDKWTQTKDALESLTGQTIEQLWPEPLLNVIKTHQLITTVEQVIEVPEKALLAYAEETADRFRLPSPVVYAVQDELRGAIRDAMKILSPKEQKVLTLRYGLDGEPAHTLEETGVIVGVTRERVRQLEARARRRMENPMVANKLAGYLA
jgi:RNA polymerase sigma factor (sigma-70 family)